MRSRGLVSTGSHGKRVSGRGGEAGRDGWATELGWALFSGTWAQEVGRSLMHECTQWPECASAGGQQSRYGTPMERAGDKHVFTVRDLESLKWACVKIGGAIKMGGFPFGFL